MSKKLTIDDIEVMGKKVLVRVDFNVPLKDSIITDDNRIKAALPTINYLINQGAKVILFAHLSKIKTIEDQEKYTLKPIAQRLSEILKKDVIFINQTQGEKLEKSINSLHNGEVLMVENTRFEDLDGKKESLNNEDLAKYWASLGDGIFVNDAFGTAHRTHASNVGIAKYSEIAVSGYLLEKEIKFIGNTINNPNKPLVAILGGAKVSDKINVIENLLNKADYILIGGAMMFTFFKAQGYNVGSSLYEEDKLDLARDLLFKAKGKIILPIDCIVNNSFNNQGEIQEVLIDKIPNGFMGLDIGSATLNLFAEYIKQAQTIIWNGPMGVFEMSNFAKGTSRLCQEITKNKKAITIIGGGDSASAAINLGFENEFSHISTGGGASLEYLEGKKLPGISCLTDKMESNVNI